MVAETELCKYPKCNCDIDFTEECPMGLPITRGHEDQEIICGEVQIGWDEKAFKDVFYNDNRGK